MADVSPGVVLLAAYEGDGESVDETSRWREHFDFTRTLTVEGVDGPVYVGRDGEVVLAVTGIGNVAAAVTVGALVSSPRIDHEDAYFVTVGSAGASPDVETVGSVVVNDRIVDWDQKYRLSPPDPQLVDDPVEPFPFKPDEAVCKTCNRALVRAAYELGSRGELADSAALWRYRRRYPCPAARSPPSVTVGPSVSGSEFWHGEGAGTQARRLADAYGVGPFRTVEMEGFGTALALERHGLLDRYVSLRGISNFVRPHPGQSVGESLEQDEVGLETCLENVYRVGSALVSRILDDWEQWRDGVPRRFATMAGEPGTERASRAVPKAASSRRPDDSR